MYLNYRHFQFFLTSFLLATLLGCGDEDPVDPPIANLPAPVERVGHASDNVASGRSRLEVAREDLGHIYAEFRACIVDTGNPIADGRTYILTNRGDEEITVDITVDDASDRNWSVHTLRLARLAPRDSFSVQVTFLPKTPGEHEISIQAEARRGTETVEVITMFLVGRGYDCREEEIPPEALLEDEPAGEPELLAPDDEEESNGSDNTGTSPRPPATGTPPDSTDDLIYIRPEDLIPPEQLAECPGIYTEAVSSWNYDNVPAPFTRLRKAVLNSQSAQYANLPTRRATINYIKVPSVASTPAPAQSIRWSDAQVRSEIERTIRWYADYCILLTFRGINLRANDAQNLATKYDAWLRTLPQNLSMGLGDTRSREGDNVLASTINAAKRVIPSRREITVLFMDRNVGDVGGRLTQGSFVPTGKNFLGIALHGADRDDPYILSHELIHALGNGGTVTWHHNSGDVRSMSRVIRRSINEAAGLSSARMLDFAEYLEILSVGLVR